MEQIESIYEKIQEKKELKMESQNRKHAQLQITT
jgi:hypothetical protein